MQEVKVDQALAISLCIFRAKFNDDVVCQNDEFRNHHFIHPLR